MIKILNKPKWGQCQNSLKGSLGFKKSYYQQVICFRLLILRATFIIFSQGTFESHPSALILIVYNLYKPYICSHFSSTVVPLILFSLKLTAEIFLIDGEQCDIQYVERQSKFDSLGKKYRDDVFFLCQINLGAL